MKNTESHANNTGKTNFCWGQVRASPYGACLTAGTAAANNNNKKKKSDKNNAADRAEQDESYRNYRSRYFARRIPDFPLEGFDHVFSLNGENSQNSNRNRKATKTKSTDDHESSSMDIDDNEERDNASSSPSSSLYAKWRLVPQFIRIRSLVKQHIDSYNHFVDYEIQQIVRSQSAREIRSEHDEKFFLLYEQCWIGNEPNIQEDSYTLSKSTPFRCRLRDATYSAPIYVNVKYTRGNQIVRKRGVTIGRMPIMLRSNKCCLTDKTHDELARLKECPYDPGGYFIIKGVEKVILIQEQLSKNRCIIEQDTTGTSTGTSTSTSSTSGHNIIASITSSTHERKSKAYILTKHDKIYFKNNTLGDDVPICVLLKAMGMESDYEICQLIIGATNSQLMINAFALSLEEPVRLGIYTQQQALHYIGTKIRNRNSSNASSGSIAPTTTTATTTTGNATATNATTGAGSGVGSSNNPASAPSATASLPHQHHHHHHHYRGSNRYATLPEDEAREVLANVVLSHIPVQNYNFRPKALYVGHIVRRVLLVHLGQMPVDDKDYYGNKRLELAGNFVKSII